MKNEKDNQVDINLVCKKHNLDRFSLVEISSFISRYKDIRPVEALQLMLEIDDLELFLKELKSSILDADLSRRLRKMD
jgi:hypothetical protein